MKQSPILFSTPMVQAILAGRKTQTRRIADVPNHDHFGINIMDWGLSKYPYHKEGKWLYDVQSDVDSHNTFELKAKYGQVGDVLWVRETWRKWYPVDSDGYTDFNHAVIEYAADDPPMIYEKDGDGFQVFNKDGSEKFIPWRPSIHMPKSACRLYLQITDIRVERLQVISEEDAKAEGIMYYEEGNLGVRYKDYMADASGYGHPDHDYPTTGDAVASFGTLWAGINGLDSWQANPWVWVIAFKRINNPNQ